MWCGEAGQQSTQTVAPQIRRLTVIYLAISRLHSPRCAQPPRSTARPFPQRATRARWGGATNEGRQGDRPPPNTRGRRDAHDPTARTARASCTCVTDDVTWRPRRRRLFIIEPAAAADDRSSPPPRPQYTVQCPCTRRDAMHRGTLRAGPPDGTRAAATQASSAKRPAATRGRAF